MSVSRRSHSIHVSLGVSESTGNEMPNSGGRFRAGREIILCLAEEFVERAVCLLASKGAIGARVA